MPETNFFFEIFFGKVVFGLYSRGVVLNLRYIYIYSYIMTYGNHLSKVPSSGHNFSTDVTDTPTTFFDRGAAERSKLALVS